MAKVELENTENTYSGPYPSVFKKIDSRDVNTNTFLAHKEWSVISGSSTSSISVSRGLYQDINTLPALNTNLSYNSSSNSDGSLQIITYYSINHLYYKYKNQPINVFGPSNLNYIHKNLFLTASVFSIPQKKFGNYIKPASFYLTSSAISFASDKHGNIYDTTYNTSSIVSEVKFYEGFNELFDISRNTFNSYAGISYVPGVPTSNGSQLPLGGAVKFDGVGYIDTNISGLYDRDHDYSISFWISASSTPPATSKLILTKASEKSRSYPFKIELNSANKIVYSIVGGTNNVATITSTNALTSGWNHVVCQKTGSNQNLQLGATAQTAQNNMLQPPINASQTASAARFDNKESLKIGGYNINNSNLSAVIDEIRIFNKGLSSADISALSNRAEGGTILQTAIVGNIFSKHGIAVISSADYRFNNITTTAWTASYQSSVNIHELHVVTQLDAGDFNMSTNITLTADDDSTYYAFVSDQSFTPYITTIGLYNDSGQLLAIGKLANAIRKRNNVDMNFLIRLDLDSPATNNTIRR